MPPRTKRTARKSTPAFNLTPTVILNPDGTIKKDRKKEREYRISAIRSKMARAMRMMNEVKEMIIDLDSFENSDVEEILQLPEN